jgi:hypothetical protein
MALISELNKALDERDSNRKSAFVSEKDRAPESSADECAD